MADYYPLLARALDGLTDNTPETRALVFDRAKAALTGQLRAVKPPLSEAEIAREIASLDEAVIRAHLAAHGVEVMPIVHPASIDEYETFALWGWALWVRPSSLPLPRRWTNGKRTN